MGISQCLASSSEDSNTCLQKALAHLPDCQHCPSHPSENGEFSHMHMSFLLIHSANPLFKPYSSVPASLRPSTMLTYRMSDPLQGSYSTLVALHYWRTPLSQEWALPVSETQLSTQDLALGPVCVICADTVLGQRNRCVNWLWLFPFSIIPLSQNSSTNRTLSSQVSGTTRFSQK